MNITEYGMSSGKSWDDQDDLYVTFNRDCYDNSIGRILKIHKPTFEIQKFDSGEKDIFDIYKIGNQFLFTHYDPVVNRGGRISLWDGNEEEKILDLGVPLTLTGISRNRLVVANNDGIRLYSLEDFRLIKEQRIELDASKYHSYTSSLLFTDPE